MATIDLSGFARPRRVLQYDPNAEGFTRMELDGNSLLTQPVSTAEAARLQRDEGFVIASPEEVAGLNKQWQETQRRARPPVEVHVGQPEVVGRKAQPAVQADMGAPQITGRTLGEPHLPDGKLPFYLGDKATHPGGGASMATPPASKLEDALAWAAGVGRVPQESVEATMGAPEVVSRRSAPAPSRPSPRFSVSAVGQSSSALEQRVLDNARREPMQVPPYLRSVYEEAPEVAAYLASQGGGLGAAQGQARDMLLGARLTRAGGMANEALSGARYDRGAMDGLEAGARQPVADLLQRRGEESRLGAEQRELDALRMRQQQMADGRADSAWERNFRESQAERQERLARDRMMLDAQQSAEARRSRAMDRAESREERALRLRMLADEKQAKRQEYRERQDEKDLQALGQATARAPFGELQRALEQIDQLAPGMAYGQKPQENPLSLRDRAARAVPFGAGQWAMSSEGQKYASSVANLRDLVSRMRSGAVLNEAEEEHYLRLLGDHILSDPAMAAAGINEVRKGVGMKLRNAQAAYSVRDGEGPSILDQYEGTGASTYRAPIFSGDKSPIPTRTGRFKRDRDGKVYAEMSDGSAVEVR